MSINRRNGPSHAIAESALCVRHVQSEICVLDTPTNLSVQVAIGREVTATRQEKQVQIDFSVSDRYGKPVDIMKNMPDALDLASNEVAVVFGVPCCGRVDGASGCYAYLRSKGNSASSSFWLDLP